MLATVQLADDEVMYRGRLKSRKYLDTRKMGGVILGVKYDEKLATKEQAQSKGRIIIIVGAVLGIVLIVVGVILGLTGSDEFEAPWSTNMNVILIFSGVVIIALFVMAGEYIRLSGISGWLKPVRQNSCQSPWNERQLLAVGYLLMNVVIYFGMVGVIHKCALHHQ